MKILYCIIYLLFIGIISNFVGDTFKRERFHGEKFPFAPLKFEKNGLFYEFFGIRRWKDRLPDMSKIRPSMTKKKILCFHSIPEITRLMQETCVAETIHFLLIVFAVPCFFIGGALWGTVCFSLWAIGNLPFIMIQRYNRARILSLLNRLKSQK